MRDTGLLQPSEGMDAAFPNQINHFNEGGV